MKFFGKELSGKAARDLITRLVLIIVSGAILVVSAVTTVAWFSRNTTVSDTGMEVVVKTDDYELRVYRRSEYNRTKGSPSKIVYEGMNFFKNALGDLFYDYDDENDPDDGAISTLVAGKLAFELKNDFPYSAHDDYTGDMLKTYYLRPGAYGTLTFYLKPLKAGNLELTFSLDIGGFVNVYDNSGETIVSVAELDPTNANDSAALDLLKGHLLFFKSATPVLHDNGTPLDDSDDYYTYEPYNNLITDGTFTYNTSDHTGEAIVDGGTYDGCYEITLYWIWPETYYDIYVNTSPGGTSKYPASIGTYVNNNRGYFFATNQSSNDPDERSDGYNDGDQKIGDCIDYIVVYIRVQQ